MFTFRAVERHKEIDIREVGTYYMFLTGGSVVSKGNFEIKLYKDRSKELVEIKECSLKLRKTINWHRAVRQFKFEVDFPGSFTIKTNNVQDLILDRSILPVKKTLFPDRVKIEDIHIFIERKGVM